MCVASRAIRTGANSTPVETPIVAALAQSFRIASHTTTPATSPTAASFSQIEAAAAITVPAPAQLISPGSRSHRSSAMSSAMIATMTGSSAMTMVENVATTGLRARSASTASRTPSGSPRRPRYHHTRGSRMARNTTDSARKARNAEPLTQASGASRAA